MKSSPVFRGRRTLAHPSAADKTTALIRRYKEQLPQLKEQEQERLDAYEKTIIQLLGAAAALVPYLLFAGRPAAAAWTPGVLVMLLIVGVVHTGLAYALYFGSMDGLKAQTVALLSYLDPVVALALSALVLKEHMTPFGIVGAALASLLTQFVANFLMMLINPQLRKGFRLMVACIALQDIGHRELLAKAKKILLRK